MMDATEYSSVEELLALGRDKEGWAARVKQIGPVDHTTYSDLGGGQPTYWAQVQKSGERVLRYMVGSLQDEQQFNRDK